MLEPWSVPSPLAPRFGMIAWAVVATATALIEVVAGNALDPAAAPGTPCWPVRLGLFGQGPLALPDARDPGWVDSMLALQRAYPGCFVRPYPELPLGSGQALAALVLGVTCLLAYAAWPRWRILRGGLVPAGSLPGVGSRLRELRHRSGTRARFLADLRAPRATGLAFGRAGRRYVLVNRGLIGLRERDPAAFDAIVLHELAHVRNRDVDVAYLTVLLWRVFVAVFLLPVLLLFDDVLSRASSERSGHLGLLFQLFLLAVLVLLTHHAVLRERELEADARAAHWIGGTTALRRIFAGPAAGPTRAELTELEAWSRPRRVAHWLAARVLSLHPEPDTRAAALDDRRSWLAPGPTQAGVIGLTVGLAWIPALLVGAGALRRLHALQGPFRHLPDIALPALAPLVALLGLAVGAMVWRAVLCLDATAGLWGRIALAGLALGDGLAAGELLTAQYSPLGAGALGAPYAPVLPPAARLAYAGVLVAGGWLTVMWLAAGAAAWRATVARARRPRLLVWPGITAGIVPLLVWLPAVLGLRFAPPDAPAQRDSARAYLAYLAHGFAGIVPLPVLAALAVLVVAVPAAGLIARATTASGR
jgi:Zn-dependent protease with chaperone function